MGIFDFFKKKTDVEEYYEKREKEKRKERYRNFNNYIETPRKNTKLYKRNETDKISRSFKKKKIIYFIKNDSSSWKKANRDIEKIRKKKKAEEKKYNNYISLYDSLEVYSEDFDYYFSGVGREEKFSDKWFRLDQNFINKLENAVKEEPEIPEADIAANNVVLVLNELLILFNKTESYYKSAEYLNDGYEEAHKLHTKILEGSERYKAAVCDFRKILEKNGVLAETEFWYNNMEQHKIDCD